MHITTLPDLARDVPASTQAHGKQRGAQDAAALAYADTAMAKCTERKQGAQTAQRGMREVLCGHSESE